MILLFAEAGGWGEALEALACMLGGVELSIVGLAIAGAVLRSPVLVGLSFLPVLVTFAMIRLSGAGCVMLAIMALAPWLAACSLLPKHPPHLNSPPDTEVQEVPRFSDAGPVASGPFVAKLFTLSLIVLVAFRLAMR